MTKSKIKYLLLTFILAGCGFSPGLYKDIIKAQKHTTNQEFEKAAEVYESILLKKTEKDIQIKINFQLGEIYSIYLNDFEKSLKNYQIIISESNEPAWQQDALEKMGKIYFERYKDYKKSEEIYSKLTKFLPKRKKHNEFLYRHAESTLHLKKYTKAIRLFKEIIELKDSRVSIDAYYSMGLAYFYMQKWDAAIESWFEFLKREKKQNKIVKTKFLIGNAYENGENLKKAYNIYYSIQGEYPNQNVIKSRLDSLYKRRIARKRWVKKRKNL